MSLPEHLEEHRLQRKSFNCGQDAPEIYHCKDCDFKTDLLIFFKKHTQEIHCTRSESASQIVEYTSQSFICQNCTFETYSLLVWLKHVNIGCSLTEETQQEEREWKGRDLLQCDRCSYKTKYKGNLKKHNISQHLASEQIQLFQCHTCSFKTKFKENLKSHTVSQQMQMFQCDKCSYKTRYRIWLEERHKTLHLASKEIGCPSTEQLQQEESGSSEGLKKHEKTHCSAIKQKNWLKGDHTYCISKWSQPLRRYLLFLSKAKDLFHCDKCLFKARCRSLLEKHSTLHLAPAEVQWYQCDKCSFKTRHKGALNAHNKSKHLAPEQIEWFQCENCSYKSKRKRYLKAHNRIHLACEDSQWFQCDKCSFKTKYKDSLKVHNINQHLESEQKKWFKCKKCYFISSYKNSLKAHKCSFGFGSPKIL